MTKNVLFVCVENAGRSQMAESFFKKRFSHLTASCIFYAYKEYVLGHNAYINIG